VLALVSLIACTSAPADTAGGGDTPAAEQTHPLVPEQYADVWDVDSLGCEDATLYWAFEGAIDASGTLTGRETWYWFFAEEGWDADCADAFDVTAVEAPTPIANDACLSCDRDFTATYDMPDANRSCPLDGYESLLDNDTRDRTDDEHYTLALMFDTNPLDTEPGGMNVWSYAQDDQDEDTWIARAVASGTLPVEAATSGPGAVTWVVPEGTCVTIKEN